MEARGRLMGHRRRSSCILGHLVLLAGDLNLAGDADGHLGKTGLVENHDFALLL